MRLTTVLSHRFLGAGLQHLDVKHAMAPPAPREPRAPSAVLVYTPLPRGPAEWTAPGPAPGPAPAAAAAANKPQPAFVIPHPVHNWPAFLQMAMNLQQQMMNVQLQMNALRMMFPGAFPPPSLPVAPPAPETPSDIPPLERA